MGVVVAVWWRTEGVHAVEASNLRIELLDALHQLIARIDVHARCFVVELGLRVWRVAT